jgi:hypothetical protein
MRGPSIGQNLRPSAPPTFRGRLLTPFNLVIPLYSPTTRLPSSPEIARGVLAAGRMHIFLPACPA